MSENLPKTAYDLMCKEVVGGVFTLRGAANKYLITEIDEHAFPDPKSPVAIFNLSEHHEGPGVPVRSYSLDILKKLTPIDPRELNADEAQRLVYYESGNAFLDVMCERARLQRERDPAA